MSVSGCVSGCGFEMYRGGEYGYEGNVINERGI